MILIALVRPHRVPSRAMKEVDEPTYLDRRPRREIRNFLLAIGAGLLIALAAIGGGAYCHDRRGVYTLANVLLAPEMMGDTKLFDRDPSTHIEREWRFDQIEVATSDGATYPLSGEAYGRLYALVAKQRSGPATPELFEKGYKLSLTFSPAGRYAASYEPRLFQEVEIAPDGDHFRVELVIDGAERRWAYFHLPSGGGQIADLLKGCAR